MGELMAEEATTQQVRSEPRVPASAVPQITGVKLSPGDAVVLVNLSAGGVLVEGNRRFVPKTRVTVNFEGEFDPPQIKGRVVRCQVASIVNGQLCYQSGIAFDSKVMVPGVPEAAHAAPSTPSIPAPPPLAEGATSDIRNRW